MACISKKKGCRADLDKQVVSPERKQYIDETIEKLKEAGKSPPKVRIGRKLGAPITDISWEQYAKALELNVSGRKLSVGDATREQLKAIGVDVDGLTAKPAQGKKEELMEGRVTFSGIGAESPPSKEVLRKVAETQADARTKSYYGTMQNVKDIPPDQLYTGVARYLEAVQSRKNENPNDILLVKNGDFYMTYFDDAHKLAASLGRAPQGTQLLKDLPPIEERSSTPTSVQSDGFPDHALGRYGADILAAGFNIVVADVPDAAPEPTPPQTKLQKAAAEKAARSVEDMATQMSDALRNGSALPETVKAIANDPDTDPDRRAAARQALESQGSQAPKPETRKALELNGFKFAGSLYKGQELSDGIDRLADKIEREALEIRSGAPYASHVTEATKDEILAQDMKRAQALRDGLITDFTTMQRLAFEISGEDVPLLG